ncbi:MAG: hydrogenase iron-sulfur subunit [Bacillota bacterium]
MSCFGVLLCRCNGQMPNIDFERIVSVLSKDKKIAAVEIRDRLCIDPGMEELGLQLKESGLERLVVAACSPLFCKKLFIGNLSPAFNPHLIEIANIREQCSWLVTDPKAATEKALETIKMSAAKVQKAKNVGNWDRNCVYVLKNKCDKCKRCVTECPNQAMVLDCDGFPEPQEGKCQLCGICLGGCPLKIISLPDFRLEEISAMLEQIDYSAREPVVVAFMCDRHAYWELDTLAAEGYRTGANLRTIPVPCTGAVNMSIINDAITFGADGVVLVGCNASQCKYRQGDILAKARLTNLQDTLQRMMLEPERITYLSLSENYTEKCQLDIEKCSGCMICSTVCPFGAIEAQTLEHNGEKRLIAVRVPQACRGCGICVGYCHSAACWLPHSQDQEILGLIDRAMEW